MIKYTKHFLSKLEDIFAESDYVIRYERGQFQSGLCVLNQHKLIVINKFADLEGKINYLLQAIKQVPLNTDKMTDKNRKLYTELAEQDTTTITS